MENMFKEISSLLSVEMFTNKNAKIKSIESAFEDCISLNSFNITGFDVSQIKSLRKIFYNPYFDSNSLIVKPFVNINPPSYGLYLIFFSL